MRTITYYELQRLYRIGLNKVQIIKDLREKKYDFIQLSFLSMFQVKCLIDDIERIFLIKNDLKPFLEFYLSPSNFNAINKIVSKSSECDETQSLLELKEFMRLSNLMLQNGKKDIDTLRKQVLVAQDFFEEWYSKELAVQLPNLTKQQFEILMQDKKERSKLVYVNSPNLCFMTDTPYYLVDLSS